MHRQTEACTDGIKRVSAPQAWTAVALRNFEARPDAFKTAPFCPVRTVPSRMSRLGCAGRGYTGSAIAPSGPTRPSVHSLLSSRPCPSGLGAQQDLQRLVETMISTVSAIPGTKVVRMAWFSQRRPATDASGIQRFRMKHEYAGFNLDPEEKRARFELAHATRPRGHEPTNFSRHAPPQHQRTRLPPSHSTGPSSTGASAAYCPPGLTTTVMS